MKKVTLTSNLPIQLTPENDAFGSLKKVEVIKSFLEQAELRDNKMFVLYGRWGSGKTTIMDYLLEHLDKNKYQGIKFEAWKYEQDDNLVLSLIECMLDQAGITAEDIAKEFLRVAGVTLKGFARGATFKIPGVLSYDLSKLIDTIDKDLETAKNVPRSMYESNKELQELFIKVEAKILGGGKIKAGKKTIIFIDDLDRCEPDSVLNLLSALKLFFTYGKSTIFFCGVDKDAIQQAVQTKYQGVIKSEEYMEKIFDISFNMAKTFDSEILLKNYFPGGVETSNPHAAFFSKFLKQLGFNTPRHIKKLLNKYDIIRSMKSNKLVSKDYQELLPAIIIEDSGNLVETLFTLYMIILFEFYPEKFNEIKQFGKKTDVYANFLADSSFKGDGKRGPRMISSHRKLTKSMEIRNSSLKYVQSVRNKLKQGDVREVIPFLNNLSLIFSPLNISAFDFYDDDYRAHINQFEGEGNAVLTNFCYFLNENQDILFSDSEELTEDYPIHRYFEMAETLL